MYTHMCAHRCVCVYEKMYIKKNIYTEPHAKILLGTRDSTQRGVHHHTTEYYRVTFDERLNS